MNCIQKVQFYVSPFDMTGCKRLVAGLVNIALVTTAADTRGLTLAFPRGHWWHLFAQPANP